MVILLALTLKHGLLMGKKIVKGPPPPEYPVNHLGKMKTIVQAVLSPLCIQNDPNRSGLQPVYIKGTRAS